MRAVRRPPPVRADATGDHPCIPGVPLMRHSHSDPPPRGSRRLAQHCGLPIACQRAADLRTTHSAALSIDRAHMSCCGVQADKSCATVSKPLTEGAPPGYVLLGVNVDHDVQSSMIHLSFSTSKIRLWPGAREVQMCTRHRGTRTYFTTRTCGGPLLCSPPCSHPRATALPPPCRSADVLRHAHGSAAQAQTHALARGLCRAAAHTSMRVAPRCAECVARCRREM